jgi:hypothetical protein
MKVLRAFLGIFAAAQVCFAQGEIGQVLFANRGPGLDAPFTVFPFQPGDPFTGPGEGWTAQLYLADNPGTATTPLVPVSTFYPPGVGGDPNSDRYWRPQLVDVPGVAPGNLATFIVRFWQTSQGTYDSAWFKGQSAPFTIAVGGGLIPPANLTTLTATAFALIPEPSTLALALLGATPLALTWRKTGRS